MCVSTRSKCRLVDGCWMTGLAPETRRPRKLFSSGALAWLRGSDLNRRPWVKSEETSAKWARLRSTISVHSRSCVSLRWLGRSLDLLLRAVRSCRFCHVFGGLHRSRPFRKTHGASPASGAPGAVIIVHLVLRRRPRCSRRTEASCRPPPYVHDRQSSSSTRRVGIVGALGGISQKRPRHARPEPPRSRRKPPLAR